MLHWLRRLFSRSESKDPLAGPDTTVPRPVAASDKPMEAAAQLSGTAGIPALLRHEINDHFANWLFLEWNPSDIFLNPLEQRILAALEDILRSGQSGANMVRRMPGLIPQLLQQLRTENFSGAELARLISHDVVLVAAVVRLTNSALYNVARTIDSIESAVLVLGHNGLRQLITTVAFRPIIDLKSGPFTKSIAPRLWTQSEQCAIAAHLLAQDEEVDHFEAFVAGLVQNAGLIASLRIIDQLYDGSEPIGSGSFCNALIQHTRSLSCSIAREWRFPETVIRAVEEQGINNRKATISPGGRMLAAGDYLSKVHILTQHRRLDRNDPRLTRGLSDREIDCLQALTRMADTPPDPARPEIPETGTATP